VVDKLSRMPLAAAEEKPYRNSSLPLRQICLEGIAAQPDAADYALSSAALPVRVASVSAERRFRPWPKTALIASRNARLAALFSY